MIKNEDDYCHIYKNSCRCNFLRQLVISGAAIKGLKPIYMRLLVV